MISYVLTEKHSEGSDGMSALTYGITAFQNESEVLSVTDMSENKDLVEKLVGLCNKLELDPVHLQDVINDMIK